MSFQSKDSLVRDRQLKVQRLVLPFQIVGSATAASVQHICDEPSIMFLKTEGVNNISAQIESDETAPSFGDSPSDANGVFNILLNIKENLQKVCSVRLSRRGATIATSGPQVVSLGTSSGIVQLSAGGNSDKIVLSADCDVALNASNTADLCLEVEYIVAE